MGAGVGEAAQTCDEDRFVRLRRRDSRAAQWRRAAGQQARTGSPGGECGAQGRSRDGGDGGVRQPIPWFQAERTGRHPGRALRIAPRSPSWPDHLGAGGRNPSCPRPRDGSVSNLRHATARGSVGRVVHCDSGTGGCGAASERRRRLLARGGHVTATHPGLVRLVDWLARGIGTRRCSAGCCPVLR